jgi:tetratricopeptide (TPR) repeat protein
MNRRLPTVYPFTSTIDLPQRPADLERAEVVFRYGIKELAQRHYEEAAASFSRAAQYQPQDAGIWYYKGDALANLGRYVEALASFDRALRLNPDYCAAWTFRGVVLIHLRRYSEALHSCDRALELRPGDREALVFRGAALQHLGQYKHAYASYDRAIGLQDSSLWQRLRQRWSRLRQSL